MQVVGTGPEDSQFYGIKWSQMHEARGRTFGMTE